MGNKNENKIENFNVYNNLSNNFNNNMCYIKISNFYPSQSINSKNIIISKLPDYLFDKTLNKNTMKK